jgi:hypothetical protein
LVFGEKAVSPLTLFNGKITCIQLTGVSGMCKKTWKSFLRVKATYLLDVPSVGADFALLVHQLVRARLEHFNNDVGPLPWW